MIQGKRVLSFMVFLGVFVPLNAVERSLIDFTTYNENIAQVVDTDQEIYEQVIAENPELDLRNFGWPGFTYEANDWNLENWKVVLNPSSSTKENFNKSLIKNSPSETYGNVLGVRLQFRPWQGGFWARIKTPYFFSPTYMNGQFVSQDDQDTDNGLAVGMIANVGEIKNVRSWVYGLNYDYSYGVRVVNEMGEVTEFGLGSIYHEGWRRLSWDNSEYSPDISNRPTFKNPLYPFSYPYLKFEALSFYKPAKSNDPNFIGYVRDVTIEFDLAIVRDDQDINDEAIWSILSEEAIQTRLAVSKVIAEEILAKRKIEKLQVANDDQVVADDQAAVVDEN